MIGASSVVVYAEDFLVVVEGKEAEVLREIQAEDIAGVGWKIDSDEGECHCRSIQCLVRMKII
jgi:hypothetical protein